MATKTTRDTRTAVFEAAALLFAEHGFDGVSVDQIADRAGVNKAMIYYHFADKITLYREIVGEMLLKVGAASGQIADSVAPAPDKLDRFIENFVRLADQRPYFPTLMLREISSGAPHLDLDTFIKIRSVFGAFTRILAEGQAAGVFRPIKPMLAYMSIIGPLLFNVARERMGTRPERAHLPMFVQLGHDEVTAHVQLSARRLLEQR
jgi:TetR/AcrR family transcriptional regulator